MQQEQRAKDTKETKTPTCVEASATHTVTSLKRSVAGSLVNYLRNLLLSTTFRPNKAVWEQASRNLALHYGVPISELQDFATSKTIRSSVKK
jgi:hypothetical protein